MSEKCVDCYRRGFKEGVEAALEQASRGELSQEWAQRGLHPRAMADGGLVLNPTLALLGEEGPELVIPLTKKPMKKSPYRKELTRQQRFVEKNHPRMTFKAKAAKAHALTRAELGLRKKRSS